MVKDTLGTVVRRVRLGAMLFHVAGRVHSLFVRFILFGLRGLPSGAVSKVY